MQEERFSDWLASVYRKDNGSIMDAAARGSRISNCRRVEQYLGDLDRAYETDRVESLIGRLELSRGETKPRHDIPINGNLYEGTATLKSAARLYQKFRSSTDTTEPVAPAATPRSAKFNE